MKITGSEKAFMGALGAGITAFSGQMAVSGQMTLKEALWALGTAITTHLFVYFTTNTTPTNPGV